VAAWFENLNLFSIKSISFSKKEPEYANPEDAASYEQNLTGDKEKDKQEKVKLGLMPVPLPKIKLSNYKNENINMRDIFK
jgi:hypothetical protein